MNSRITHLLLCLGLGCTLAFALPQAATKTKSDNKASEKSSQPASANKVDLNSASQKDLEALPGVGSASAKKIIAGRPYAAVSDLQKAGLSAKTIEKITPLVAAGASAPSTNPSTSANKSDSGGKSNSQHVDSAKSSSKESSSGVAQSPTSQSGTNSAHASPGSMSQKAPDSQAAQQPPQPGMVWANLDTKVYHQAGHRWYGKTKHGQFMTEQDAIKAGFHASKE